MTFAISGGKLTGLDRPAMPAATRLQLASDFSADYAAIYRTQPHVRTVISFLARNIASIGLHTFERISDTDRRRLTATESPLAALIKRPNPRSTRYRWVEALVSDLGIYDVTCHVKMKTEESTAALLRLPPASVKPKGDEWAWATEVTFKGSRGSMDIPLDNLLLIHGYNPEDARWGLPPMETLRQILAEEFEATRYRQQMWRNGARFAGVIKRPKAAGDWSPAARDRFRNDWRGLYTGAGPGAGGTPILEDGMEFEKTSITPAEAQYLETRKLTREEVASAFHIPPPMVGILEHATFGNIEEQHKMLYQDTLGPWLTMIEQELDLQLVPEFDSTGKVYVEFNLAEKLKGSFEEQATSLQTAVGAPWLTRNEARARQNLPALADGDDLVTPLNVLVGGQASPTDSAPKHAPRLGTKARAPKSFETKHEQVLRAFFKRQAAAIRSRLGAKAGTVLSKAEDWWDAERWNSELSRDLYALAAATTEHVGKETAEGMGFAVEDFDIGRTLAFLTTVTRSKAEAINEHTRGKIADALEADEPDEAVAQVLDANEQHRASQLAVTAVTAWSGFATTEAAKQVAGDVAVKTWVTGPKARPSHARMSGETVPISETFSNGLEWPGDSGDVDEVAGCNCSVEISIP